MRFPAFMRHWRARYLVNNSEERGGVLYDYANGRWKQLEKWTAPFDSDSDSLAMIDAMLNSDRDDIYVMGLIAGNGRGCFIVVDSRHRVYERYFWDNLFSIEDAMKDITDYCRLVADSMGYRRPDNTTGIAA